jgi:hypothetical protein
MHYFRLTGVLTFFVGATAFAQVTPDQDFQARCAAAGVVKCVGFDNTTSDVSRGTNVYPDGQGTYRVALDTSVKASGGGSMRFDLPPPPHAGQNIAGSWSPSDNNGLGRLFGQNSTFYVQFRQRFSPEMLSQTWDSSWKTVIFHQNQLTCAQIELTTNNRYLSNLITMYTECGNRGMSTNIANTTYSGTPPYLMQQGTYACPYGQENTTNCLYFVPNEWLTFYYKIQIGTWDQNNSTIEAWVARQGSTTYKQFIRVPNFNLHCNTDPCSSSPGKDQGYNNLTFTPYMTGLSSSSGRAGVTSKTWYDELIVSTQPIAAPGGRSVIPQPPTNVSAN